MIFKTWRGDLGRGVELETTCEKCGKNTTGKERYPGDWVDYYQKYYESQIKYQRQLSVCWDCWKEFEMVEFSDGLVSFYPPRRADPNNGNGFPFDSNDSATNKYDSLLMGKFHCSMCQDEAASVFTDCSGGEYGGSAFCFDCLRLLMGWYEENVEGR